MMFAPTLRLVGTVLLATALNVPAVAVPSPTPPAQDRVELGRDPIDDSVRSMYNLDFEGAHRALDAHLRANPLDPVGHAARAAAGVRAIKYHVDYNNDPLPLDLLAESGISVTQL